MKKIFLLLLMGSLGFQGLAQSMFLEVSAFNNSISLPLSVKLDELHPGFIAGINFKLNRNLKHELFQSIKTGYFYQAHIQHGIPLFTEFRYRFNFKEKFFLSPSLGLGYMHGFPDHKIFRQEEKNTAERATWGGRPYFRPSINLSGGYHFSQSFAVFISYEIWMQGPFIEGYVPLLPNNSLHFGVTYNLPENEN